jgi:hypothetical protein
MQIQPVDRFDLAERLGQLLEGDTRHEASSPT